MYVCIIPIVFLYLHIRAIPAYKYEPTEKTAQCPGNLYILPHKMRDV